MKRKRVCQSLWAAALVVLSAGCVKEPYPGGGTGGGGFTLTAVAESMSPEGVITRASDPKTAAECEIRTLHVFLFGPDGNYLGTREGHRIFQGYQQIGSPTLHIDAGGFSDPAAAASATVYVVANVEPGTFGAISAEGYPEKIRNKADFDAFYYQPTRRENISELPESGMPMFGSDTTGVDLTQTDGSVVVEMKALMARVDFSFHIETSSGAVGSLPSLVLTECEVKNVPTRVPLVPLAEDAESNLDTDGDGQADATTSRVVYIDPSTGPLRNQQGEAKFSFYIYENQRHPGYAEYPGDYPYPAGLDPNNYQRYKPLLAIGAGNDTIPATYAVFKGIFSDVDGIDYRATWTMFLGGDPESDFNVRRNHQYRNNVIISGITAAENIPSDVVTFDARVNVQYTSPYYVSILRHKDLDAHFCVIPMDVYLFDEASGGQIDVRIEEPQTNTWFRIERVSADVMRTGQAEDYQISHPGQAFVAGTGKRKYFTRNLVTDPAQLANSTSATLSDRDRIYIYVDENVSVNTRQADLIIEYRENGVIKDSRTITLIQHGLMPVRVKASGVYQYTIYVEAYEEYRDYYDPLSEWTSDQVYEGLPWGPANMGEINTGLGIGYLPRTDAIENYYEGKKGTIAILMATGVFNKHWTGLRPDGPAREMVLDEVPQTAAEYCYRKNKTDASGMISEENTVWYLPAIRELENVLTTYYPVYKEFQENFYWSSAAARRNPSGIAYEASEYARATMAYVDGSGSIVHKPSGADEFYDPDLGPASRYGKALRTQPLRIRAVYRPSDGGLIDGDSYP